ncbi:hypothetical protein BDP27DRAFT_1410267 [Rhodocollybia butyracea]|uniref:Uncharacterized protein n=1 Tax=Rhodocollybia butyracea TaxID=206335 RepID=A0A9P5TW49_9AGAR|nr:hypothetical protein BDP27DRAFT_1410267 [Rhodocollybia butyracea]
MDIELIRGRLYLLTKIAAVISETAGISVASTCNIASNEVQQAKLLNHLAIIFSRGGEDNRVVATYAAPVLAKRFTAVVASERLDVARLRNLTKTENYKRVSVIEEELVDAVEEILKHPEGPLDYHTYIQKSMCVLRHTAIAAANRSDTDRDIFESAIRFFLAQCFPKIQSRFRQVHGVYLTNVPTFKTWAESFVFTLPTSETHSFLRDTRFCDFMIHSKIPYVDVDSKRIKFSLNSVSFPFWIKVILKLLGFLRCLLKAFSKTRSNLGKMSSNLQLLHQVICCVPAQLWTISQLDHYLLGLRLRTSEPEDKDEFEDRDEYEDRDELKDDVNKGSAPLLPECALFLRAVDAICAWTTAVNKLVSLPYLGSEGMVLDIHIIDLPKHKLAEPTLDNALSVWGLEEYSTLLKYEG